MQVDIYSDLACPWCYIGKRRFERALSTFPHADQVEVVFRPYQLDPHLSDAPRPLRERLQEKFGPRADAMTRQVTSVAAQEGLEFRFDEALAVNTLNAHRLLHLTEQEAGSEAQRTLAERLFAAHFTNGENIADPELLVDLAVATGLTRERMETYLASDEGVGDVQEAITQAQRLGIRAVPTFVFDGRQAVQGAQPTSTFQDVLETIQRETDATETDASSA